MKNKTGGKGHKRQKNNDDLSDGKNIILATDDQDYGILIKKLGNGYMMVQKPYNDEKDKLKKQVLGIVRGKIRKRVIFDVGDLVLYSVRVGMNNIYSKEKIDIIHKYDSKDKKYIRKSTNRKEITTLLRQGADTSVNKDDDMFEFEMGDDDDGYDEEQFIGQQNRDYDISSDEDIDDI
jgi:hypothetical protein